MSRFILALLAAIAVAIGLPTWTYSSLASPMSKDCAQLETDKELYKPREIVTVSFTNNCPDTITLNQPFPWMASCITDDGQVLLVVGRLAVLIITRIQPGQRLEDAWDLVHGPRSEYAASRPEPVPEGRCIIQLDTLDAGLYTTSFEIRGDENAALKDFDANDNGVIDDKELFMAIDQWVAGQVSDELFFAVIDAWVSQTPLQGAATSSPKAVALSIHAGQNSLAFIAAGSEVTGLAVEVYALSGQRVFSQQAWGTRLVWNLETDSGKPVANGVYLYVVTALRFDGRIVRAMKKLVVLR